MQHCEGIFDTFSETSVERCMMKEVDKEIEETMPDASEEEK